MDCTTSLGDSIDVEIRVGDPLLRSNVAATLDAVNVPSEASAPAASCVILGATTLDRGALEAISAAATERDHVIVVCGTSPPSAVRSAVAKGAQGVVVADRLAILPLVLAAVARGQVCVPAADAGAIARRALTFREKQVLALVVAGRTNAEIAATLFLAESTVKSHLSSAFGKLGVSSRSEAAQLILDPDLGRGFGVPTATPAASA